ncbi:MAG: hypothetical protein GX750_06260 [Clostridia bacterium]|nr:hypothetical protein [Clostridia bacterium]
MLVYSVMPPQWTLEGFGADYKRLQKTIDGVQVELEPAGEDVLRITRVISTNPRDFLNPNLQPGRLVINTLN